MRSGTPEEIIRYEQMDNFVATLIRFGVSEDEIRDIIYRAERFNEGGIHRPFPARRYMIPSDRNRINRMRELARMNLDDFEEGANAPAPAAAAAIPDYLNMEDEDIDSKDLEQYKEMIKCPVCIGNIKDVRLSPCGHMMCKSCVKTYIDSGNRRCPVCTQPFASFDKVYYSKYLKYKNKYVMLKNKIIKH
jgi:hypothetical protein